MDFTIYNCKGNLDQNKWKQQDTESHWAKKEHGKPLNKAKDTEILTIYQRVLSRGSPTLYSLDKAPLTTWKRSRDGVESSYDLKF